MLGLDITYLCTKFDHYSFSHSRYTVGAPQNLDGSHDLTMPLSGMVCHPWAGTCYNQSIYQIWSLYLHLLWIYERRYKISKIGWLGV